MRNRFLLALVSALGVGLSAQAQVTNVQPTFFTVSTGQAGANVAIDSLDTNVWNFSVGAGYAVTQLTGTFEIKRGSGTTDRSTSPFIREPTLAGARI